MTRIRFTIRRMMAVVVLSAVAVWAGMHGSEWRETIYQWWVNRTIRDHLNRRVTFHSPDGMPFEKLLVELTRQANGGASPRGLVLYLDPIGVQDAGMDLEKPPVVRLEVESVPLKDALETILKRMGLKLFVRDGVAVISSESDSGHLPGD